METKIENLETSGVVNMPYPPALRKAVERTMKAWKKVCELPEEVRTKFPYNSEDGIGVGYELKKTHGSTLDIKEDFHFAQGSQDWLIKAGEVSGDEAIKEFVSSADGLVELMKPAVVSFAGNVERTFSVPGFSQEVAESSDQWVVRFLHYFGGAKEGEEIAKAHADKSGFTLHLYESHPGLQYLDKGHDWKEMKISSGETAIIPGMRGQYRSQGRLKATFHRVVATEETAKTGRYSAVAFIHLKNTPAYDKARAGRLQEFEPGFNYEMPFEEFKKLFK
jgi:isopenicillin N synthase-like dioxygenase